MSKCPVCNTADHTCGPPTTHEPQDLNFSYRPDYANKDKAWYKVNYNGVETQMLLSEYDQVRRFPGAVKVEESDGEPAPKRKGRPPKKKG